MQRASLRLVVVALAVAVGGPRISNAQDPETLYRRAVQALLRTTFEAKGSVQSSGGASGEFLLRCSFADGILRTWIEVQKPADQRGQRFLLWNRLDGKSEGWWYDPKTKQVKELDAAGWKQPFLKSDFLLGDFLFVGTSDHRVELGGEERYGGETFTVVHLYAKNPSEALYPHRAYSVDPRQNVLLRALYFDAQDKPAKRWVAEKLERRGSEWFPTEQKILLVGGNTQASSSLRLTELRFEPELSKDAFEKSALSAPPKPTPKP